MRSGLLRALIWALWMVEAVPCASLSAAAPPGSLHHAQSSYIARIVQVFAYSEAMPMNNDLTALEWPFLSVSLHHKAAGVAPCICETH